MMFSRRHGLATDPTAGLSPWLGESDSSTPLVRCGATSPVAGVSVLAGQAVGLEWEYACGAGVVALGIGESRRLGSIAREC